MPTLNTIIEELNNIPVDRLEDLYSIIHSLQSDVNKNNSTNKKIISFAGSFSDMNEDDYNEFIEHTKNTRDNLFSRDINL